MFINFIDSNGGNVEELEQQISALTEELNTVSEDFADVVDRSVETLTVPSNVSTIGENAFASCSALTEVVIHSGVTSIEANAFADNTSLETITFEGDTPPTVASGAFSKLPADVEVIVPSGATGAYSAITEEIEESTAAVIYFYSGNTVTSYSPSGKTIDYGDEALQPYLAHSYDKIETVGVETLGANCFLWTVCPEYYFDEKLTMNECTPFWHDAKKIVFSATTLNSNFDARLFSSAAGGCATSSLTFCANECPSLNIEHYDPNATNQAGVLYVPEGSKNWHKLIDSGLTSAWTVCDVANSAHTLGCVITTTSASTDSYWCYGSPGNARYVFNTDIISAEIKNLDNSGGQTFQGCTNLSSVTIDGHIRLEGNIFYGCSNLTEITWLNETAPSVDGSGQFDGVASAGTLYVNSGSSQTWENFRDTYLSGWTVAETISSGSTSSLCEINGGDDIVLIGGFVPVGDEPAAAHIVFDDGEGGEGETLDIQEGHNLIFSTIGEYYVEYDSVNDEMVIYDSNTLQPATQQQQDAIGEYVSVSKYEENGQVYYHYENFNATQGCSVEDDDYTSWYTVCELQ